MHVDCHSSQEHRTALKIRKAICDHLPKVSRYDYLHGIVERFNW